MWEVTSSDPNEWLRSRENQHRSQTKTCQVRSWVAAVAKLLRREESRWFAASPVTCFIKTKLSFRRHDCPRPAPAISTRQLNSFFNLHRKRPSGNIIINRLSLSLSHHLSLPPWIRTVPIKKLRPPLLVCVISLLLFRVSKNKFPLFVYFYWPRENWTSEGKREEKLRKKL